MICCTGKLTVVFAFVPQKRVVAVVDGVTLVAAVSVKVLQDGDSYSSLLQVALRLHGRCLCRRIPSIYSVLSS